VSLSEVIAWGPLGPGGDPAMSLQGCSGCGGDLQGLGANAAPVRVLRRASAMNQLAERREHYRQLRGTRPTRLGEVIQWAPLGPGGDPQMSLQGGLGVLSPGLQQQLDLAMGQLETTDAQVYNEIAEAYASGASDNEVKLYQDAYDRLLDRLIEAQTASRDLQEDQWNAFGGSLAILQTDYEGLLSQLFDAREQRRFGNRATGLAWGLGTAAAAAGILWVVWRNRKK
jgi:hypothetical protein